MINKAITLRFSHCIYLLSAITFLFSESALSQLSKSQIDASLINDTVAEKKRHSKRTSAEQDAGGSFNPITTTGQRNSGQVAAFSEENQFTDREEQPKDLTFDVVTWNIEWFGSTDRGPEDEDLQLKNVIEVIKTIDADLYALQEIAEIDRFEALDDSLDEYRGFTTDYFRNQQVAYLFKSSVIDSINSGPLQEGQSRSDWASGRFPLMFEFNVTISEQTMRVFSYNIHAKAFSDEESYERRKDSAMTLKQYLDERRRTFNVLLLGDFNDMLSESTYSGEPSPYNTFVEDEHYFPITLSLEEQGAASFLSSEFKSMIDHIISTNLLTELHIDGVQEVENPEYIENFISTTSDHAPVWTRFDFTIEFEDPFEEIPDELAIGPNYPNPFGRQTIIPVALDRSTEMTIRVFDILGRPVQTITDQQFFTAGEHQIQFTSNDLGSGVYIYRIELGTGEVKTGKMTLLN